MATVNESVDIEAPIERVWAVIHEDFSNASKWTKNLERVEELTDGPFGEGTVLRWVINTPGGRQQLEVEHTRIAPGRSVAGRFIKGPVKGDWKYTYAKRGEGTRVTYSMNYEPNGFTARLFFGLIEKQIPEDIARTLQSLKKYVESGKGPKAKAAAPARPKAAKPAKSAKPTKPTKPAK